MTFRRILLAAMLLAAVALGGLRLIPDRVDFEPSGEARTGGAQPAEAPSNGAQGSSNDPPSAAEVGHEVAEWVASGRDGLPPLLVERTRERPSAARAALPPEVEERFAALGYDDYRRIEYRREASLWADRGPYRLQFFHPGAIHTDRVRIQVVDEGESRAFPFRTDLYEYHDDDGLREALGGIPLDFAGLRVLHPLNRPGVWDEVAVFLGASYFRLLGQDQVWGLSGRGVAVNTMELGREEFPAFREFWVVRPDEASDRDLHLFARLEGESVSGAYRFRLEPGAPTVMEVEARLHVHRDLDQLGLAPLTSMFLTAPATGPEVDDFRPRIHDSDGLLLHTQQGEWIWRPLSNGPGDRTTSLPMEAPRGFGLTQRNRDFSAYLDLEARYHDRPGLWVEILEGDWGTGSLELLELETDSEFADNVVVFWAPRPGASAGDEVQVRYRLVTIDRRLQEERLAPVAETRIGSASLPGATPSERDAARRFVVDFHRSPRDRAGAAAGDPDLEGVQVRYRASTGQVSDVRAELLPDGMGWRATFVLTPEPGRDAELGVALHRGNEPLTETWAYRWIPSDDGGGP